MMAIFTPYFPSAYSDDLIFNINLFVVGDEFKKYVDSVEIVYDNIYYKKQTGFSDVIYNQNEIDDAKMTGSILITLGDLPHWLCQQLTQLANAVLKSGMSLIFTDWVSESTYYCKWENALDFSEISPVLCAGNMELRFFNVGAIVDFQNDYGVTVVNWQDTYETVTANYQDGYNG